MTGLINLIIEAYRNKYRYQKSIDRLQLEIEEISIELQGLGHKDVELTPEQARSSLPMPSNAGNPYAYDCQKILGLIELKDEKEAQIDALMLSLKQAEIVNRLSLEDQKLMQDLYHSNKTAQMVADDNGYSVPGMYKHIRKAISKVI